MKNKGLIISLIVLGGILVMLLVTMFLINFSDTTIQLKKQEETEVVVEATVPEYIPETTIMKKELNYSISHYTYTDGMDIDIEYPVISGMENPIYENNINAKLNINATGIILLHEDKDKIDTLKVTCTVQDFDEKEITVTYQGELKYKTNKNTTTKKSTKKSSGSSNRAISSDPNYDTYGGVVNNNAIEGISTINTQPSSTYDSYAPYSGQNNINFAPSTSGMVNGFASTKVTTKKIFYTSVVNLEDCTDVSLSDYANIPELVKYVLSNDIEYANISDDNMSKVSKYLKRYKQKDLENLFNNADFKNTDLRTWPKCFSYRKNDYIYFSLPISSELGDYAILKYQLNSK